MVLLLKDLIESGGKMILDGIPVRVSKNLFDIFLKVAILGVTEFTDPFIDELISIFEKGPRGPLSEDEKLAAYTAIGDKYYELTNRIQETEKFMTLAKKTKNESLFKQSKDFRLNLIQELEYFIAKIAKKYLNEKKAEELAKRMFKAFKGDPGLEFTERGYGSLSFQNDFSFIPYDSDRIKKHILSRFEIEEGSGSGGLGAGETGQSEMRLREPSSETYEEGSGSGGPGAGETGQSKMRLREPSSETYYESDPQYYVQEWEIGSLDEPERLSGYDDTKPSIENENKRQRQIGESRRWREQQRQDLLGSDASLSRLISMVKSAQALGLGESTDRETGASSVKIRPEEFISKIDLLLQKLKPTTKTTVEKATNYPIIVLEKMKLFPKNRDAVSKNVLIAAIKQIYHQWKTNPSIASGDLTTFAEIVKTHQGDAISEEVLEALRDLN